MLSVRLRHSSFFCDFEPSALLFKGTLHLFDIINLVRVEVVTRSFAPQVAIARGSLE